jgi:hypothetical protein
LPDITTVEEQRWWRYLGVAVISAAAGAAAVWLLL